MLFLPSVPGTLRLVTRYVALPRLWRRRKPEKDETSLLSKRPFVTELMPLW